MTARARPAPNPPSPSRSLWTKGLYSVLLGDTTLANAEAAIPASVWANADVRLRVWFNDGVNGFELLRPDQRLAPNGYLPDYSVSSVKITPGAVTSTQLAANAVQAGNLVPGAVEECAARAEHFDSRIYHRRNYCGQRRWLDGEARRRSSGVRSRNRLARHRPRSTRFSDTPHSFW